MSAQARPRAGLGGGMAARHEGERREDGRGVGGDSEEPEVAVLHADIPEVEGRAHRPEAEGDDGAPIARAPSGQTVVSKARWQARLRAAVARQKPATASVGTAPTRAESTE